MVVGVSCCARCNKRSPVSVSRSSISSIASVEGTISPGKAAGRDRRGLGAHLLAQTADDPVDEAGEAVDDAGADRVDRRLADHERGATRSILRQPRGALGQRLQRDLDARGRSRRRGTRRRRETTSKVIAVPKSTTMHGAADALEGGDGVDEAVGAELARVVDADRHPGLACRARRRASRGRGSARPSAATRAPAAGPWRRRSSRRGRRSRRPRSASRLRSSAPSSSAVDVAHGREAPVLDQLARRGRCRSGSGCCRRRRRGAWARKHRWRLARPASRTGCTYCAPAHARPMLARCPTPSTSSTARIRASAPSGPCSSRAIPYRLVEMPPPMHAPISGCASASARCRRSCSRTARRRRLARDRAAAGPAGARAAAAARGRRPRASRGGRALGRRGAPAGRPPTSCGRRSSSRPGAIVSYGEGSKLPLPGLVARLVAPLIARIGGAATRPRSRGARDDLAALPGSTRHGRRLDRGRRHRRRAPNAADLQIAPSLRLLGTLGDVRPLMEGRPCWALAQRVIPSYAGYMPTGALPV